LISAGLNSFLARKFMALVPSQLRTETPEKICLHLYQLSEPVTVKASLQFSWGSRSLFNDLVVDKDMFHCVSFTLPRVSSSEEKVSLSVHVKGPKHEFSKTNVVMVKNQESVVFVQTDKPMYKPGQPVKFRVVAMDTNLHPLNELDPKTNRIMQWRDINTENGLKQLSFSLSSEPILGSYKIVLQKQSGVKKEHYFTVEEFVLPRFEVRVKVPKAIFIKDEKLNVTVCGVYTYGKPVPGHVKIRTCHKYQQYRRQIETQCRESSYQLDNNGCSTQEEDITELQLKEKTFEDQYLHVNAKITEEGTGLEFSGSGSTKIERAAIKLIFVKADSHFKQGIPFIVKVRLVDVKGAPIPNEEVFIKPRELDYTNVTTTDQHGLAEFSINTTNFDKHSLTIKVMAKDHIIQIGSHTHHTEPGKSPVKGDFDLNFPVELSMAPVVSIFVYAILPDGEMIADSAKFEIEKCLRNRVDLSFTPARSLPASQAHLQVTASPQSLCGLRAVDQSVLLLRPEAELSPSWIYNLPELRYTDFIPTLDQLLQDGGESCVWTHNKQKGEVLLHPDEKDVYSYVKDMGLNAFTNLNIKHRKFCIPYDERHPPISVPALAFDGVTNRGDSRTMPKVGHEDPPAADLATETIRKYFPETWIWDLVTVNSSGVTEMEVTVPDTITEWKAGAFCLSNDTGLGLSPVVSLQAFQPFFVELTMPYSVIRGEAFTLKATVINYLPTCIRVGVLLEDSPDFTAVPVAKDQDSHCLCANGRHTASWLVTPKSLGNVNFSVTAEAQQSPEPCGSEVATVPETGKKDTVVKVLIVEPEGIKKEHTFRSLLCASDAKISEKVSLKLPTTVVDDSARAHFSVQGDILSSAIKNTQNLLHMPFGCGEQNMVLFAPNIYVLKYLNETQQLTQNIKSKAIGYLTEGYQRELNYKHKDGSYSAFGDQDGQSQGNTWLTAFVLKSFAQARAFIFIDETHITHAFTWLSQQQQDNGCFRSSGSLFNNAMKGGVKDEVTLSAYITIALLESSLPDTHPVVSKALTCLESSWNTIQQEGNGNFVYTKALLAYAFALAGNQDKRNEILKSLDNEAIKEEKSIHWERPQKPMQSERSLYKPQAPSAEVEMNAYVLLTLLTAQPAPTPEDLGVALHIVKWLTKQQNPHGGFSSTQDTVVALHALSKYGAVTFAGSQKTPSVTIQSSGTFSRTLQIESSNRLLLQQVSLPDIPGDYDISVSGEGCVYAQVTNQTLTFSFVIQQDIPVRNLQPAIVKVYDYYETDPCGQRGYIPYWNSAQPMALLARSDNLELQKMLLPTSMTFGDELIC
ncbi:Murinoglobulin-2, partial [Cricetulus griseus]